jgi:hypothetical protein
MKKYVVDEDYFLHINTPEKAYWLGFIWCDGYVSSRRGTFEFKLGLSESDKGHLEKLKKAISSTHEIKIYNVSTGHKEARLYISNKRFAGILFDEHEVQPHRPYSDSIEHLIEEFMEYGYLTSHFMRGVIDADGSIKIANKKYGEVERKEFSVSLSSHPKIVNLFNNALLRNNVLATIYRKSPDSENCVTMQVTGNNKVENILDWIYVDCGDSMLDRKHEKYLFVKNYMENYRNEKGEM